MCAQEHKTEYAQLVLLSTARSHHFARQAVPLNTNPASGVPHGTGVSHRQSNALSELVLPHRHAPRPRLGRGSRSVR